MPKRTKNCLSVSISIPFSLLSIIDGKAEEESQTRSEYILEAVNQRINDKQKQQVKNANIEQIIQKMDKKK